MSGMCPVAGNSPDSIEFAQDDTPLGRPQIIEHAVGLAVVADSASDLPVIFGQLQDDLEQYHRHRHPSMKDHDVVRAEKQIERDKRNAVSTVVQAKIDDLVICRVLPLMEKGESLVPSYLPEDSSLSFKGLGHNQEGLYDDFIKTMTAWYIGAAAVLYGQEHRNPEPFRSLWYLFGNAEKQYQKAWDVYATTTSRPNPPFRPFGNAKMALVAGLANNVMTIQSALLSHQRIEDKNWNPELEIPYSTFIGRTALAQSKLLTSPASTKRSVTSKMLSDPVTVDDECGVPVCCDPLMQTTTFQNLLEGIAGSRRWNHPSLAKGSWPVRGNCVGDIPRPVTPSMERKIDRFFELAGAAYAEFNKDPLPRGVNGEFSAVMVRHIIGSLVGEHTMFKQRLPTQKDYVIVN